MNIFPNSDSVTVLGPDGSETVITGCAVVPKPERPTDVVMIKHSDLKTTEVVVGDWLQDGDRYGHVESVSRFADHVELEVRWETAADYSHAVRHGLI